MDAIRHWLAPPAFADDPEKTRQAALINLIGICSIAFVLLVELGSLLGNGTPPASTQILDLTACLVMAQLLRWLRRGRVALAGFGLIIFGLVYIIVVNASLGGINTPTASVFVFWVLVTGLLFDLPGVLFGTAAASLAVLGLIVAKHLAWLPEPYQGVAVTQWITFTTLFGFASGLTYYINLSIKRGRVLAEESERRYRTLVEWTPEALVVYRNDLILYVNPAGVEMLGAGAARDVLGTSVLSWVDPDYRSNILARRADRHKLEHDIHAPRLEEKLRKVDGTVIDVEIMIRTIDYNGEAARQALIRDITQSKITTAALEAARLEAEHASRSKSRFLASGSHDLRQPAHALGLFVSRLAEVSSDEQTRQLVEGAQASVRTMQDMLDQFFDIARLESEHAQVSRVAFPIQGVFAQLRDSFADAASTKGLHLRFRPSKAWVRSDPGLLHRILLNLVSNAVKYTQQGAILVACRVSNDPTQLRIEVRDSGVGIDAQHHENIFEEFFQVGNFQRDRAQGLGVGLSIVDRACRLLNHPLALQSASGCGTRFTLTVPLAPARAGGSYEDAMESASKAQLTGLRVLLIEDDELGRVSLAGLLRSWGCDVMDFSGAQAACDAYRQDRAIDIIISDYRLGGGINGVEAVARFRTLAGVPIAACLISGDTDLNVRSQAQAAGMSLLQKPVRPAKLRGLIRHMVQAGPRIS